MTIIIKFNCKRSTINQKPFYEKVIFPCALAQTFFTLNFCFQNSIAQKGENSGGVFSPNLPNRPTEFDLGCINYRSQPSCNYILNNTFSLSNYDPNTDWDVPFIKNDPANPALALVHEWWASHGTPNAFDGVNPLYTNPLPFLGAGYARMACFYQWPGAGTGGEGIIQKIPRLRTGHSYALSFFKKTDIFTLGYVSDHFKIILTDCQAAASFTPPDYPIPSLLSFGSQIIYCEQGLSNANWQQVFINFTATGNYDMIMIYPEKDNTPVSLAIDLISYPELVDITAGPEPYPTPGNCTVTIGPPCSVKNAVYAWQGPNGQSFTGLTHPQIQVNASNPLNVGTWTLTWSIPNAIIITSNTCSQQTSVSATINVPGCTEPLWPKVYEVKLAEYLRKDNYGNMFTLFHETQGATPNINHQGVPLGPSFPDEYLVQYNKSSGLTDWNQPSSPPLFVLNSGAIQLLNYSYVYGSTGNASTAPSLVPFGETIIAETHNGGFITLALNPPVSCTIYSHAPSLPDGQINPGYYAYYHTFNPSTGRLVISNYLVFDIYDLSPTTNTFQWVVGGAIPNQGEIAHVDNQDRIYMKRNGALEQYDYSVTPGVFIPISISGFINSNIETMKSDDPYTSDICLIKNIVQGKLYAIDFSGMTEKNISTSDIASPKYYVIDGNTVYISGSNSTGTITIGSQSIPPVSLERSTYIAKFNLLSDFSLRIPVTGPVPKNVLNLQLFPNPATNSIRVTIGREVYFNKPTHYSLSIIDQMKNKVLHIGSYTSDASLDISRLLPGVYYVEIIDDKGVRSGATFLKF